MAVASPLLEASMDGAHGVLLSISGGSDLGLFEINEAASLVSEAAHQDANFIFGAVIDDALGDEVRVTVIAAGFDGTAPKYRRADSRVGQQQDNQSTGAPAGGPAQGVPQPVGAQPDGGQPLAPPARSEAGQPQAQPPAGAAGPGQFAPPPAQPAPGPYQGQPHPQPQGQASPGRPAQSNPAFGRGSGFRGKGRPAPKRGDDDDLDVPDFLKNDQ
jgi:cell division protein FtsZ